jgi:SAM-dependent methyltransferase
MSAFPMNLPDFIQKWTTSSRTERASSQEHFIDLCRLLGQPTPNEADPTGEHCAFEKGVTQTTGGQGYADVWKQHHFGWEYKGRHANLNAAYQQLLRYREDLKNPPLMVVCDLDRFEVHTNFTDTAKKVYAFNLSDLASPTPTPTCPLPPLEVLRAVFTEPQKLRPEQTTEQVTKEAAVQFATLADSLRQRGEEPQRAAHFLMRLLFCLFTEDIRLLPAGLFTKTVENSRRQPSSLTPRLRQLFGAMATGGFFGSDNIAHFDGGLFADDDALDLTAADLSVLSRASQLDWASVEPAIFGTLFERSLDPSKRAQLGAHFTSRDHILMVVEPVLMAPLRRRWKEIQQQAQELIARRDASTGRARENRQQELTRLLMGFAREIAAIRVLDPACGSGNFLYVALKLLLDLEKEVIMFATANGLTAFIPQVGPEQLFGIEVNPYAHELAQVVVWIGYIQWLRDNGFGFPSAPILKPLHNIVRMDAILAFDEEGRSIEPEWPEAEVVIGNPPFLGNKKMRSQLGDVYVDDLRRLYRGRVPGGADLVAYWFERTRAEIAGSKTARAGLLATQSIRGGANRTVVERIQDSGDIFMAWSDRRWILDGAAVQVSMIGFSSVPQPFHVLDGLSVQKINPDLTSGLDLTIARPLADNRRLAFQGPVMVGPFDIDPSTAERFLSQYNLHG